jgi:hypothetical protein
MKMETETETEIKIVVEKTENPETKCVFHAKRL